MKPVVGTTSELRGDEVTMTARAGPGNGYDGICTWWEQFQLGNAVDFYPTISFLDDFGDPLYLLKIH